MRCGNACQLERIAAACAGAPRQPRPGHRVHALAAPTAPPAPTAISAEHWPSSHRRHRAARDHWAHAPACPSVSAPFLRPRLLSPIACALPRRHSRLAVPVSSRSRIIVGVVPLGPCPYRAHPAAPPSASAPRPSCRAPHPHCAHRTPPASPSLALRRQRGPGWQESRRMHPFFAECAKKAPSLAISARNACFSRSKWQDPRLMRPFPGAIGRFGMHGARILPSRPPFSRRGPRNHTWREDVANAARPFAAPRRGSRARELALRPAVRALPACRMHESLPVPPPRRYLRPGSATHRCHSHVRAAPHRCRYSRGRIHRRCPSRRARRAHYAASPATPPVASFIAVGGGEPPIGRFPRCPAALALPMPSRQPRRPRSAATRAPPPRRAGSAAVPAIPAK